MSQTTILITGANRGLGRAIAEAYLARPNHTIIALVRDPSHETAQSLLNSERRKGKNSQVVLIPYDASSYTSADEAIKTLSTAAHDRETPIEKLDIVIANAGFSGYFGSSLSVDPETFTSHYIGNTIAPMLLLKACLPLLKAASDNGDKPVEPKPKFIALSSGTGSTSLLSSPSRTTDTSGKPRARALPYTAAKCALNHVMCTLALEVPEVQIGLFTPGPTKTGFGGDDVKWDVVPGAMDVETVVDGLVDLFDGLGQERRSGGLVLRDWAGKEIPW